MGNCTLSSNLNLELLTRQHSDDKGYHFAYDIRSKAYDTSSYRPEYSGGNISLDDCQIFADDCSKLVRPMSMPYDKTCLLSVISICCVPAFLLMYFMMMLTLKKNLENLRQNSWIALFEV